MGPFLEPVRGTPEENREGFLLENATRAPLSFLHNGAAQRPDRTHLTIERNSLLFSSKSFATSGFTG